MECRDVGESRSPNSSSLTTFLANLPTELTCAIFEHVLAEHLPAESINRYVVGDEHDHPRGVSLSIGDTIVIGRHNIHYATVLLPLALRFGKTAMFKRYQFYFNKPHYLVYWLYITPPRVSRQVAKVVLQIMPPKAYHRPRRRVWVLDAIRGLWLRMGHHLKELSILDGGQITRKSPPSEYLAQFCNLTLSMEKFLYSPHRIHDPDYRQHEEEADWAWRSQIREAVRRPRDTGMGIKVGNTKVQAMTYARDSANMKQHSRWREKHICHDSSRGRRRPKRFKFPAPFEMSVDAHEFATGPQVDTSNIPELEI